MKEIIYKIDEFLLDPATRQLFLNNHPIQISSRAFDILLYLIKKRGQIIEKNELLENIWSDSFVEENNLAVHISALRRVLNEKRGESKFIKTISGRGYSFIASVQEVGTFNKISNNIESFSDVKKDIKNHGDSIAVLPFTFNEFNDDIEYLANGLTQSLISDLSKISNLKVMAHSAVREYRNSGQDLQEIGFLLGVQKILTGHISDYKDKLEISVELVNADDKSHLWGVQYDFEFSDILRVKKNIFLGIAEKLKFQFPKSSENKKKIHEDINSDAFRFYLKGKYILETISIRSHLKKDLNQALRFFKNALKENPKYALAYIGIGETFIHMFHNNVLEKSTCYFEAKKSLQLSLNLDNQLSEAYALKGIVHLTFELNLIEAEKSLEYALSLNVNNAEALHWLSYINICFGRFELALSMEKKAIRLDPISIAYNNGLLRIFYFSGDYNKAITQAEEILELDSRSVAAHFFLAMIYAQMRFFGEALTYIEATLNLRTSPDIIIAKAYIYALMKENNKAEKLVLDVLANTPADNIDYTNLATVYATLNDKNKAYTALDKSYERSGAELTLIKVNPKFENLRNDKRFKDLLKKINLI